MTGLASLSKPLLEQQFLTVKVGELFLINGYQARIFGRHDPVQELHPERLDDLALLRRRQSRVIEKVLIVFYINLKGAALRGLSRCIG